MDKDLREYEQIMHNLQHADTHFNQFPDHDDEPPDEDDPWFGHQDMDGNDMPTNTIPTQNTAAQHTAASKHRAASTSSVTDLITQDSKQDFRDIYLRGPPSDVPLDFPKDRLERPGGLPQGKSGTLSAPWSSVTNSDSLVTDPATLG